MNAAKPWFLYLIECVDGSIYTGITVNVEARYMAHIEGRGARYTRSHKPLRLLGQETHPNRSAAAQAEYRIKQLSAAEKRLYANHLSLTQTPKKETRPAMNGRISDQEST